MKHKGGGIKNFPTAPLQGQKYPPAAWVQPVCASFPFSLPLPVNVNTPFSGWGGGLFKGGLNAKYAPSWKEAVWRLPGDILSLHTACSPNINLQRTLICF